jgi:hypothetical protein
MSAAGKSWTVFRLITVLILTVGTAGWVLPGYIAAGLFMTGIEHDSFESFPQAHRMLKLAAIWLFAVLFVWGFMGARRLLFPVDGR